RTSRFLLLDELLAMLLAMPTPLAAARRAGRKALRSDEAGKPPAVSEPPGGPSRFFPVPGLFESMEIMATAVALLVALRKRYAVSPAAASRADASTGGRHGGEEIYRK